MSDAEGARLGAIPTPEEFEELMAIVRSPPVEPPLSEAGRWRKQYREAQRQSRVVAVQEDLFGGKAVTHYRRHAAQSPWQRPALETVDEKLQRIAGDPFATFGPERADRPSRLSDEARAAVVAGAENWLRLGQRVRIVDGPGVIDPAFGNYRHIGRAGVVYRLCSSVVNDHVYVFLDPVGSERSEKIVFVELRDVAPIGDD